MDISKHTELIRQLFSYDKRTVLPEEGISIVPYQFVQAMGKDDIGAIQNRFPQAGFATAKDDVIAENSSFNYNIFTPGNAEHFDRAILLLHGLNERNWNKYFTWAEYLCSHTQRPVILFPIAFHMNRTPSQWYAPRFMMPWLNKRKEQSSDPKNATFANAALSQRLTDSPERFYTSGRESFYNIWQLLSDIRHGLHPLFNVGTTIDIFSYSIGALLSQVLTLVNPDGLLTDSRLFMFCGGSIFSRMNGSARDIMDQLAFDRIYDYYLNTFATKYISLKPEVDSIEHAFRMMLLPELFRNERESAFAAMGSRLRAVSLAKDTVIPTVGIREALGEQNSMTMLRQLDFDFDYSHQNPFPCGIKQPAQKVNNAFEEVFSLAIDLFMQGQMHEHKPIDSTVDNNMIAGCFA